MMPAKPSTPMVTNHTVMMGPNSLPMRPAPLGLEREHREEHHDRQRHHIRREGRHRTLDAFKRAQDRDRRRDGAVAIDQRRAQYADRDHAAAFAMLDAEERHQRQDAALPVIVGPHDDGDIFD